MITKITFHRLCISMLVVTLYINIAEADDEPFLENLAVQHASEPVMGLHYGWGIDVSWPYVFAGEPSRNARGAVYIVDVSEPAGPLELGTFESEDQNFNQSFGQAIAIHGRLMAVGAPVDDDVAFIGGAAYLFDISDPINPVQLSKIRTPIAASGLFGYELNFRDSELLVITALNRGRVFLYDISDPTAPILMKELGPPPYDPEGGIPSSAEFGLEVKFDGNRMFVGAFRASLGVETTGAVFIFDISDLANPIFEQVILPPESNAIYNSAGIGRSVAIDGARVAIGAPSWREFTGDKFGAVVLYDYDSESGDMVERSIIRPSMDFHDPGFGYEITISGNHMFVPALGGPEGGACYVYDISDIQHPVEIGYLNPEIEPGDFLSTFGGDLRIHDDKLIFGNYGRNAGSIAFAGAFNIMRENVTACRGDFNADGTRDVQDLLMLLKNWNSAGPGADILPPYDNVDVMDLQRFFNYWGQCQWGGQ